MFGSRSLVGQCRKFVRLGRRGRIPIVPISAALHQPLPPSPSLAGRRPPNPRRAHDRADFVNIPHATPPDRADKSTAQAAANNIVARSSLSGLERVTQACRGAPIAWLGKRANPGPDTACADTYWRPCMMQSSISVHVCGRCALQLACGHSPKLVKLHDEEVRARPKCFQRSFAFYSCRMPEVLDVMLRPRLLCNVTMCPCGGVSSMPTTHTERELRTPRCHLAIPKFVLSGQFLPSAPPSKIASSNRSCKSHDAKSWAVGAPSDMLSGALAGRSWVL